LDRRRNGRKEKLICEFPFKNVLYRLMAAAFERKALRAALTPSAI
jgi:hypothetical protein